MERDPYRYFRIEARELVDGLSQGLIELEKAPDVDRVRDLLRLAHTLKGAARVVKQSAIAERAHALEDWLAPYREAAQAIDASEMGRALGEVDAISGLLQALDAPAEREARRPGQTPAASAPVGASLQQVGISVDDMDHLLEAAGDAVVASGALGAQADELRDALEHARLLGSQLSGGPHEAGARELVRALDATYRRIGERAERIDRELAELQARASDLRLVPAQVLIQELERTASDAARELGKRVVCRSTGGDRVRLDAHVLSALRGALRHAVRNALAHGIEDADTRVRTGKPAAGQIDIVVERRARSVAVSIRDDGRGIDLASARRAVAKRGLAPREGVDALDVDALLALLARGGVSTAAQLTEIAGRGVGLDVVRTTAEKLNGEMSLSTRPGEGTCVELVVASSLASLQVLAVEIGAHCALIPLDSVRHTLRVFPGNGEGARPRVEFEDDAIPLVSVGRALGWTHGAHGTRTQPRVAVVVRFQGRVAALGVDRLLGVRSAVVRPVPEAASAGGLVTGAAMDDGGEPRLVLSVPQLVDLAFAPAETPAPQSTTRAPRVLVIDDSVTTRMLEQSILEAAGYAVELASSAEEALRIARTGDFQLFLVDVEMPGMNGFEFVAHTRADPALREIPAILVTSCADAADVRRGKEVGARAHIDKRRFDQRVLIDAIRRLAG